MKENIVYTVQQNNWKITVIQEKKCNNKVFTNPPCGSGGLV